MAGHRAMQARREPPEPDIHIGNFIRKDEIGKGSFATVYLALHKNKKSYAAIKAVQSSKLTKKLRSNLDSEISILKSLQHPHIVAMFDCFHTPSYIYLVMEYCQMSDLAQFMKSRSRMMELRETADIFRKYPNPSAGGLNEVLARHFLKQVASAVEFLRSRNLVHRDIKPQNLLLNPPPTYMQKLKPEEVPLAASEHSLVPTVGATSLPMLKLADFGFARHLPAFEMAETLCGSPLYMAPEILGYKVYDAKADLWSLGAVAYEMVVGKPPFRAQNHVELLKKIEQAEDVIAFPPVLTVSRDYKTLIRSLLKRDPVMRISYETFFQNRVIAGDIPGLVEEDISRTSNAPRPGPDPTVSELSRRMQQQAIDNPAQSRRVSEDISEAMAEAPAFASAAPVLSPSPAPAQPATPIEPRKSSADSSPRPSSVRPLRADSHRPTTATEPRRPVITSHATAPPTELPQQGYHVPAAATSFARRPSSRTAAPSMSAPQQSRLSREIALRNQYQHQSDRIAQDIAEERDWVHIDKQSIAVNAFADELNEQAADKHSTMVRRATSQGLPTSATGTQSSNQTAAIQLAAGKRGDPAHMRQPSYERRYAPSPFANVTQPIQNVLKKANVRLFSAFGTSPPFNIGSLGKGVSPPQGFSGFPQYPSPLSLTDGRETSPALDEDSKLVRIAEEAATRSDVVYGFAEVKFKQLVPAAPSAEDGLGIRQIGALEVKSSELNDEDELTQIAVLNVAEEAFVLYMKTLSVLLRGINLVRCWWDRQRSVDPLPGSLPTRLTDVRSADASRRMNNVVQWARTRFNECLEKSEVVRRRLMEAQKQLPPEHPFHPSNHTDTDSTEGIHITTGVTAEKLMFDRAVEMSRAAAINELVGEDFPGCELNYVTAVILLEAVLESDEDPLDARPSASRGRSDYELVNGMDSEDRKTVLNIIEATRSRLIDLRKRISVQNAARRMSGSGPKGPSRTPSSPAVGTPPK